MSEALTVLNNVEPSARVEAQKNALARLFQLKPAILELVSKSTRQEGAVPGTFRVTSTNEKFETMRAVILLAPVEQRSLYRKGEFSNDAKLCFSLDNFAPHRAAKDPKSMYCEVCTFGDKGWLKYRDAKNKGVTGDELSALVPSCRRYWHLFLIDRQTKRPYYFNVRGLSVGAFEKAMKTVADLFNMMIQNIKQQNKQIALDNAKAGPEAQKPTLALPGSIDDVIWKISFTMYAHQPQKGGVWVLGLKDFAIMQEEDQAEFGVILQDFVARRAAGRVASQEETEGETVEGILVEPQAESNEVAKQNSQIQI